MTPASVLLAGAEGTRAVTRARRAGVELPWTPPELPLDHPYAGSRAAARRGRRHRPRHPLLPAVRARAACRTRARARRRAARVGRAVGGAHRRRRRQPVRVVARRRAPPHEVGDGRSRQPHGLLPVSEVTHRQPVREPGRGVARDRRRDRPGRGHPEDRWVYPLGGAGADEPTDPRTRVAYHHVPALDVTVREVQEVTGTDGRRVRRRRALQLLPGDAQVDPPRARSRRRPRRSR